MPRGRERDGRKADALSADTDFSGLPKAYRGTRNASPNGFPSNTWASIWADTVVYNYGGFTFSAFSGQYWSQIIIPEPGIYDITVMAQFNSAPGGGNCFVSFLINGVGPLLKDQVGGFALTGATTQIQTRGVKELKAGDTVGPAAWAGGFNGGDSVDTSYMSIHKLPGQY